MGTVKCMNLLSTKLPCSYMERDISLQLLYNACIKSPSCNYTDSSTTLKLLKTCFFALYLASAELLCPAVPAIALA